MITAQPEHDGLVVSTSASPGHKIATSVAHHLPSAKYYDMQDRKGDLMMIATGTPQSIGMTLSYSILKKWYRGR